MEEGYCKRKAFAWLWFVIYALYDQFQNMFWKDITCKES